MKENIGIKIFRLIRIKIRSISVYLVRRKIEMAKLLKIWLLILTKEKLSIEITMEPETTGQKLKLIRKREFLFSIRNRIFSLVFSLSSRPTVTSFLF